MAGLLRNREQVRYGMLSELYGMRSEHGTEYEHSIEQPDGFSGIYTTDIVGNREDINPFETTNFDFDPCYWTAQVEQSIPESDRPWDYQYYSSGSTLAWPSYSPSESDEEFITRAVAGTNPSAADFDAPIFLAELRDVPSLLKTAGHSISKYGANEFLKWQYGWRPLIKDLQKLMNVTSRLHGRVSMLKRLKEQGVIVRRYKPPNRFERVIVPYGPTDYWPSHLTNGHQDMAPIYMDAYVSIERWATVHWKADMPSGLPDTDDERLRLAMRAAFGGTIDGSTLWELMPWSWLIDWNTNMSEFISSKRNIVGASPVKNCLMKTTQAVWSFHLGATSNPLPDDFHDLSVTSTPGKGRFIRKERLINLEPSATTTGEISLINGDVFKQSILGALSIQRLQGLKPPRI
jgi:hypothetical protein